MDRLVRMVGVCAGVLALTGGAIVWAGQDAAPGLRSRRLVHLFDFEERKLGNFESMPMHWYVVGRLPQTDDANFMRVPMHDAQTRRAGFGPHSFVAFDRQHHVSDEHSFHLGLNGGSAGAFLEAGALTAVPHSDYLITASVRTDPLQHARAVIVAYFIDVRGHVIHASRAASEPIQTDGAWQDVTVRLMGDFNEAAYIGLELILQQPDELVGSPLGPHQVVYQEVRGGAWFDDIGVWQLPHVEVNTASPVNILRQTRPPELHMEVRDLTGQAMLANVAIYDHTMSLVASMQREIGHGAPPVWRWTPPWPRHGWFLIDMQVRERRGPDADARTPPAPIARTLGALLWLAPEPGLDVHDVDRFAINAEGVDENEMDLLAPLLAGAGLDATVVSAWSEGTTLASVEQQQERLDGVLSTLAAQGRRVTVSLNPVPRELGRALDIDPQNPAGMFAHPEPTWLPYLAPVLMRQGQVVRRWQVGTPTHPQLFHHPDPDRLTATIDTAFRDLAPDPRLVLPWSLTQTRRAADRTPTESAADAEYALDVPPSIPPTAIAAHLAEWHEPPRGRFWLYLREPGADAVGHEARTIDLALRMLHGWESGARGLALTRPWTAAPTRHAQVLPDPLLGVFTTVAHRLAGRRVVGRLHVAEGIECMILDSVPGGSAGGALAVWNRAAEPGQDQLAMFLGAAPVAIDLWGNRKPIPLEGNRHTLQLTHAPVFIEGIDPSLALFRSTFKLDRPFIESTQTRHQRVLSLANPWNRTISGHFHVLEPADWLVNPRRQFFSIAAGATADFPIEMSFPVSELSGPKTLSARFDFVADQRYVVDLTTDMEVGLRDVVFDATLALITNPQTGRDDAAITMLITNTGGNNLALYAFANLTGYPRQERIISQLQPGQSIVRRFTFPDAAAALHTHPVRVGLRETNGPAVLNKSLAPDER